MIIGICGLSGSGKDAAGKFLVERHGFVRVAFADIMKRICMEVFDFTEEQVWGEGKNVPDKRYPRAGFHPIGPEQRIGKTGMVAQEIIPSECLTPRLALQKLGSWGRECYPDVWAEKALRDANTILDKCVDYNKLVGPVHAFSRDYDGVVITDVRFKNEIAAIKKAGGKVVRILRPGHMEPKWNHASETEQLEVGNEEFDYILHNDGDLEELADRISYLMLPVLEGRPQCVPER
jgi:hypothetical protein